MQDCSPAVTHMDPGALKTLTVKHGPLLKNEIPLDAPYREIIGALLYLSTHTRPDIAVAVNILSRHVRNPRECHWEASKRILRYLRKTKDHELLLNPTGSTLKVASDSDWGGCADRVSFSGYTLFISGALVGWMCQRQKINHTLQH